MEPEIRQRLAILSQITVSTGQDSCPKMSATEIATVCLIGARDAESVSQSDGEISGLSDGVVSSGLSRSRISFPVLKAGIAFLPTATIAPVRGLRP